MAANLNVFKTSKKDCTLSKSNFSFAEVHWVIYMGTFGGLNLMTILLKFSDSLNFKRVGEVTVFTGFPVVSI